MDPKTRSRAAALAVLLSVPGIVLAGDRCTKDGCWINGVFHPQETAGHGIQRKFGDSGAPFILKEAAGFSAKRTGDDGETPGAVFKSEASSDCPDGTCPLVKKSSSLSGGPVTVAGKEPPSPCAGGQCGAPSGAFAAEASGGCPGGSCAKGAGGAFAAKGGGGGGGRCGAGSSGAGLFAAVVLLCALTVSKRRLLKNPL